MFKPVCLGIQHFKYFHKLMLIIFDQIKPDVFYHKNNGQCVIALKIGKLKSTKYK